MAEALVQRDHLRKLLDIYRGNLNHLEVQIATHGGRGFAPIPLVNQAQAIEAEIKRLESELAQLAEPTKPQDLPGDVLIARLEGLLGYEQVAEIRAALQQNKQADPGGSPYVSITRDGNIIGSNNLAIPIANPDLRKELHQEAPKIATPTEMRQPIRVFISSTMRDMQPEREAVERAIDSLSLEAVRAETIGSQTASPLEASLVMARECDIYLGILGGRYGTEVPNDGRSVTHIEYETARALKKPILIYRKIGIAIDAKQQAFHDQVGHVTDGHICTDLKLDDVPTFLIERVQHDIRAEVARHPEWAQRSPAHERVLLAALGKSPGAVTGFYHALARSGKRPTRVQTFAPNNQDVSQAQAICQEEFDQLGVPYRNEWLDAKELLTDVDLGQFKGMFLALLRQAVDNGAEVLVGITGGRAVMGALMAMVAQTMPPEKTERVSLYHLTVAEEIEVNGRLPLMLSFRNDQKQWRELLAPPAAKCHLIRVPFGGLHPSSTP